MNLTEWIAETTDALLDELTNVGTVTIDNVSPDYVVVTVSGVTASASTIHRALASAAYRIFGNG
jgi:hypothetical protein